MQQEGGVQERWGWSLQCRDRQEKVQKHISGGGEEAACECPSTGSSCLGVKAGELLTSVRIEREAGVAG